jgi:transposase
VIDAFPYATHTVLTDNGMVFADLPKNTSLPSCRPTTSPSTSRRLLADMLDQWRAFDTRIRALPDEFAEMARKHPAARRLATIPASA